jgi:hypothetical protein
MSLFDQELNDSVFPGLQIVICTSSNIKATRLGWGFLSGSRRMRCSSDKETGDGAVSSHMNEPWLALSLEELEKISTTFVRA